MRLKVSNVCQLINKAKIDATKTVYGVTFTNDGSGVVIANGGPSTGQGAFYVNRAVVIDPTHIYLNPKSADIPGTCALGCDLYGDSGYIPGSEAGFDRDVPFKFNSQGKTAVFYYVIFANKTVSNLRLIPQFFDLTEMYGAGNEPTTIEQFRQDFPNEMYEYSPVCWKKFRRLKYIANKEPVQLLDKSKFEAATSKNVTATPDTTNGMWTISGAATASEYLQIGVYYPGTDFNIGDKLFLRHSNIDNSVYFPFAAWYDADNKYLGEYDGAGIFSVTNPKTAYISCYFATRTVADINVTTQVQLFNLTRMYGKGDEPTTAEFVAQYPGFDYSVNKYSYLTLNRGKYIANKEPVQLLDKSIYPATTTNKGVTFTNNGDGTIIVNGTATDSGNAFNLQVVTLHKDHLYFIYADQSGTFADIVFTVDALGSVSNAEGNFWKSTVEGERQAYFWVTSGITISNRVYKPQLFDLTEMYGTGHEPTTVAQFRADYPNELYDYNPYNAITFR